MVFDPRDDVEQRIETAMREYRDPDSEMTTEELEERIDRAVRMEYTHEELREKIGMRAGIATQPIDAPVSFTRVLGVDIEPGETVSFADEFDIDPLQFDADPWEETVTDDERTGPFWRQMLVDGIIEVFVAFKRSMYREPEWNDNGENGMWVRGDVEITRVDNDENRKV